MTVFQSHTGHDISGADIVAPMPTLALREGGAESPMSMALPEGSCEPEPKLDQLIGQSLELYETSHSPSPLLRPMARTAPVPTDRLYGQVWRLRQYSCHVLKEHVCEHYQ